MGWLGVSGQWVWGHILSRLCWCRHRGVVRPWRPHPHRLLVVLGGCQSCPGGRGPGRLLLPSLRPSRDPQSLCSGSLGLKAERWPRGRELKQGSLVPVSLAEARVAAVVAPP